MLSFHKIGEADLDTIKHYIRRQPFRTCDFSVFGIFLWADYYNYAFCIHEDTFFLKRTLPDNQCEFAVPIGSMPTGEAIELMKRTCKENGNGIKFNFVPETALKYFTGAKIKKLEGWSDYVYLAEELKTLKGKRFGKKRNRLNKFQKTYQNYHFERITEDNLAQAKDFFEAYLSEYSKDDEKFAAESTLIRKALQIFFELNQIGGLLYVNGEIVAMTIGEIIGDTLIIHVEKALRQYDGAYEAINHAFANDVATEGIRYINREEDMGDTGLRQAKKAYNPVMMIQKYMVTFS